MEFQPLDPAIKKKIRLEQEAREKARLARMEEKLKAIKDSDLPFLHPLSLTECKGYYSIFI